METGNRRLVRLLVGATALLATATWLAVPPAAGFEKGPSDRQSHDDIYIEGNHQFNPAHGITRGSGTKASPFVISGYDIGTVYIKDTSARLMIKNNAIDNLYLNWNGAHVKVVDNEIGDLRLNENIERTGDPTSGLIARNTFDVVGQLRHWDGDFQDNVVGAPTDADIPFFSQQAVNFDGFNGSHFRRNTVYGYVDVRLHGHHHGSNFHGPSHYHGSAAEGHHHHHGDMKDVDHSKRYHRVVVSNNKIYSAGPWALRYVDDNHAGNDRTAASETNPALNEPHQHFTHVTFKNNKLYGSGIYVDIFNADDELHTKMGHGAVWLLNNRIALDHEVGEPFASETGIRVDQAQHLKLFITGNRIGWLDDVERPDEQFLSDTGIELRSFDVAKIHIFNNSLTNFEYGIYASEFSDTVRWWVGKLDAKNVGQTVYYDDSVANRPHRGR